jgi:hypothetical protein
MQRTLPVLITAALLLGCGSKDGGETDAAADAGEETDVVTDAGDATAEEEPTTGLSVISTNPDHGPFVGGQTTVVRGSGFEEGAEVYFGEHMVQEADTHVLDDHKIQVLTPANPPGPVTVRVVQGVDEASRAEAYTYDTFYVDPPSGSIAGGTLVTIEGSGTAFDTSSLVSFDGRDATEVDWMSATRLTCRTPQGTVGPANVVVEGEESYRVDEAYTYFNSADPINGGLGGGPIEGTVNVTVLNAMTDEPVPEAFTLLELSDGTSMDGLTNATGQITFSEADLSGTVHITAAKEGFEASTVETFDARDVTILLMPNPDPEPGPLPPGRYGAVVEGEVVFSHGGEFGPGPWEIVPDPGEDEQKVAYVYGTGWSIWSGPPSPTAGGTDNEVHEDPLEAGDYGYRFECFVRPDAVAVYALAGLENTVTGKFTPYAFGIARNIIAGPGERIGGVYIYMTHELNTTIDVFLDDPAPIDPGGFETADTHKVDVFIDLGGDGVIWRDDRTALSQTGDTFFSLPGWLPLEAELADATYTIVGGTYREHVNDLTGQIEYVNPFSVRIETGITSIAEEIVVDDFIGIPDQVEPGFGEAVEDGMMSFEHERTAPDFWLVMLQTYPDQTPLWQIILPGDQTSFVLPDLTALAGLPELPSDYSVWVTYGIESPGFVYDEWSYRYLNQSYWSAYSADVFLFMFRE